MAPLVEVEEPDVAEPPVLVVELTARGEAEQSETVQDVGHLVGPDDFPQFGAPALRDAG